MRGSDVGYGRLLGLGVLLVLAGIFVAFCSFFLGSPATFGLGILSLLVGVLLIGLTLFSGLRRGHARSDTEPVIIGNCRIVAKYSINQIGEMIFSDFDRDAPGGKLYVRLMFPDGKSEELQCAVQVFGSLVDGMYGTATVQGDWLGGFQMTAAPPGTGRSDIVPF